MLERLRDRITFATVMTAIALFGVLAAGGAYAASQIGPKDIAKNAVRAKHIKKHQVKAKHVAKNAVRTKYIKKNQVKAKHVAKNAVRTAEIQDGAVTAAKLAEGAAVSGPQGPQGPEGPPGPATGPAGGDLTGSYPNPTIAAGAVSADKLADGPYWRLGGNAGTDPASSDNQPLNFRVNSQRALRLQPVSLSGVPAPNLIGGSPDNQVSAGVHSATIAGGGRSISSSPATANRVTDNGGTVGGGGGNQAGDGAGSVLVRVYATVGGGLSNTASGSLATVGGGQSNTASGSSATVAGGQGNTAAGDFSFAAGHRAKANHQGAFVWGDSRFIDFASTAQNEFAARATGGVRFASAIDAGTGAPTAGVALAPGASAWAALSDRASKENLRAAGGRSVLRRLMEVPIHSWNWKAEDDGVRHMGPIAQDFHRAFGLGADRKRISTVDADGVALAAIQGLNRKLGAERAQRRELERRIARLERRLSLRARG